MNKDNLIFSGLMAVLVIIALLGGFLLNKPPVVNVNVPEQSDLGVNAGPDSYFPATFHDSITANGAVSLTGYTTSTGGLTASGGFISSGNTTLSSTTTLSGPTTISGALSITNGSITLATTTTSGTATFNGAANFNGAVTMGSTLAVGAITGSSTLSLSGTATLAAINASGAVNFGSTLGVGAITGSSTLAITGASTLTGGATIGSGGSAINAFACATSTWDPGSVSSSTAPATLAIANGTGAVLGDTCEASFDSATSTDQWNVACKVTASASGSAEASSTIYLSGISGAAVDISTSTARVCTTQF